MASNKYVFKKPHLRWLAGGADSVGYLFKKPRTTAKISPKRVLVVRLDQLGDIVQTLPFLTNLRKSFPDVEIDYLTTPIGAELLRISNPDVHSIPWNCPWFDKSRTANVTREELTSKLRERKYDCVFDLRGDARLICFLRTIKSKLLIGSGQTGLGFFLDVEISWEPKTHAVDKNLKYLEALGLPVTDRVPHINLDVCATETVKPLIAVHPDAGTSAKKWPIERFVNTIDTLTDAGTDVVLVGLDQKLGADIEARVRRPIDNKMGKTSLPQLVALLSRADGLLSNDSGPAHLAAALDKPVWVLWSGTAVSSVWAPRGNHVKLFEHPVSCAPCSLAICPIPGHPCLTGITVETVLKEMVHAGRT